MRSVVEEVLELKPNQAIWWLDMLDVGCGLGQAGAAFRTLANRITGVDISKASVDQAQQTGLYDEVHHGDVLSVLPLPSPSITLEGDSPSSPPLPSVNNKATSLPGILLAESMDIVVASDSIPYFGALDTLFEGVSTILREGGLFVFNVDLMDQPISSSVAPITLSYFTPGGSGSDSTKPAYNLELTGRWSHSLAYIEETAMRVAGMDIVKTSTITSPTHFKRGSQGQVEGSSSFRPTQVKSMIVVMYKDPLRER